jgi:hypothetical protein
MYRRILANETPRLARCRPFEDEMSVPILDCVTQSEHTEVASTCRPPGAGSAVLREDWG